jgi:hypothetical protein
VKEQQSGLVKKGSYARHLPSLAQQQVMADARRQAAYEAEVEADQSYKGHFAGVHPEHRPYLSGALPPISTGSRTHTRAPVPVEAAGDDALEEDESYYTTRLPTSARRYQVSPEHVYQQGNRRYHVGYVNIPPRTSRHAQLGPPRQSYRDERSIPVPPATRYQRRMHPLLYLGVGMLAMCALFLVLTSAVNWIQEKRDDVTYGRPRTFQLDAVVGHHDSAANPSHFIALNLNRHVEVIEIPGGDSTRERVYLITILFGDGEDSTPVTLSFRDVNGDGKPDMLVHIENQTVVEINDNGQFRLAKPGEVKGLL